MKKLSFTLVSCLSCLFCSTLYAAYDGGSGTEEDPYLIQTAEHMNEIGLHSEDWSSYFVLANDIDMSAYTGTAYNIIGNATTPFTGHFNGTGHVIRNFTYAIAAAAEYTGLFGYIGPAGQVGNLTLAAASVQGDWDVGVLAGYNAGSITHCSSTGVVDGDEFVGGLIGENKGSVIQCYSLCSIDGCDNCGGLAGSNTGNVSQCYAGGNILGIWDTGGLVGDNTGTVIDSYAAGMVTGDNSHGGYIGGLIGVNSGPVSNCYAAGAVSGFAYVGGLIGDNGSTVSNCFWDTDTSGQPTSAGGEGKTTTLMQTLSTFTDAGWDFSADDGDAADWLMPADSYPRLAWEKIITFSPDGGTYLSKQNVTITYPSPTATIHYTVNGNAPTESDPVIVSGSSVLISKSMTLKARAWEAGSNPSEIKSANYQINLICPTADLNGDCKVDLKDFAILSQWWLDVCNPANQWCEGMDLDLSGMVDTEELEDILEETLEGENIADHVKYIAVDMEWDYQETDNPNVIYSFQVSVCTDETVALVSFKTPTGLTIVIPAMDKVWDIPEPNGLLTLGVESYIPGEYDWEYGYKFNAPEPLSAYGDGLYTITVYYTDGGTQQTTVWFGIPGTTDPLPQPTQEPVFTSIHNGDTVSSPVTFTWEACTDPAVEDIYFINFWPTGWPDQYFLTPEAVGLYTPIELTPGIYYPFLAFLSGHDGDGIVNDDGIPYSAYKNCGSYCTITVE